MKVTVNGRAADIDQELTLADLLSHLGLRTTGVAVALNREFVPRQEYVRLKLHEGDEVEVLSPQQGG